MDPSTLRDALELIETLRGHVRQLSEHSRDWQRYVVLSKWSANPENRKNLGALLTEWENHYDEEIERKCSGEA